MGLGYRAMTTAFSFPFFFFKKSIVEQIDPLNLVHIYFDKSKSYFRILYWLSISCKLQSKCMKIIYKIISIVDSNRLFFSFIFIIWRLITLQYCSGFCHTLTWISHGFTCVPHPNPPSRLPLHPIPLGLPHAPALSTCLMYPTWAGDLFHPW